MDGQRFDEIAIALGTRRRAVLGALLAGASAPCWAGRTAGAGPAACKAPGQVCTKRGDCCATPCRKKRGKKQGRCKACGGGAPYCNGVCCRPGEDCVGGACTCSCGAGRICAGPTCVVGQGTCPTGTDTCAAGVLMACNGTDLCACYPGTEGDTRCAHNFALPGAGGDCGGCADSAQCARKYPDIPGVFCVRTAGTPCCGGGARGHCLAPCPF